MVLYHCCNSFALAQVVERQGFEPAEFVQVTDVPPPARTRASCPAMVVLGVPFGFGTDPLNFSYGSAAHATAMGR